MNDVLKTAIAFVVGAAAGSGVTYLMIRRKYEQKARHEIEEIRDYYAEKLTKAHAGIDEEKVSEEPTQAERTEMRHEYMAGYTEILQNQAYNFEPKINETSKPKIITPSEFCMTGYTSCHLEYYPEDETIYNTDEAVMWDDDDIDKYLGGEGWSLHFGEYEDDFVYIRNDFEKVDYEIHLAKDE